MKKFFALILLSYVSFAQTNQLWKGYYSYNEIKDVSFGTRKVIAATENALFSLNSISNDVKISNSINGFKPEEITSIYYSQNYGITFTGNQNGLLIISKDDGTIINKVDIINEVPVPPNNKRINHFFEHQEKLYIATSYGISVLKLNNLEFEDTFYIGSSGEAISVLQTTVFNNEIYAVTQNFGIKKAVVTNPNLIDFNQWQTFDTGSWVGITNFNNQLVALNSNNAVQKHNGTNFQAVFSLTQPGIKFISNADLLTITTANNVYVLDVLFSNVAQVSNIPDVTNEFSCALTLDGYLYIGTKKKGLFQMDLSNQSNFLPLSPDGPILNYVFRVKKIQNTLWATYGSYNRSYDVNYLFEGISKYTEDNGWDIIPKESLFGATTLTDIVANPKNQNEVYVCSFQKGLLKIKNNEITLFDHNTSPPNGPESQQWQPVIPNFIFVLINGPAFDKDGNLWMSNSLVYKGLKVLKANGQWQSVDFTNTTTEPFYERYSKIVIDKNGTKWIPSFRANGVIAFNENYNNKTLLIKENDEGNLPNLDVRCLAIDTRNQLWIGTYRGLRILSSVDRFTTETELTTNPIIIEEDGVAQELFYQQSILDIAVDGANNKWVSVAGAGVFLVSPNGQETIYRFTTTNSPLPSNNVVDIEIDDATGEVFFATEKGLISFLGINTKGKDDLSEVFVYPNPVRPDFYGTVKISGLIDSATVKITDVEGNLVHETTSEGGTIEWDTTAFGKYKVASGVYLIFISSEDGLETKVKKVMIVR